MPALDDGSDGHTGRFRLFDRHLHRQRSAKVSHSSIVVDDGEGRTFPCHRDLGHWIRVAVPHSPNIAGRRARPV